MDLLIVRARSKVESPDFGFNPDYQRLVRVWNGKLRTLRFVAGFPLAVLALVVI